jgi:hypothetical protein
VDNRRVATGRRRVFGPLKPMADTQASGIPVRAEFDYTSDPALLAAHRDEWSRLREKATVFRVPQSSGTRGTS